MVIEMLANIQFLNSLSYQGTTRYRYRVDGTVWVYSLDSALDPSVANKGGGNDGRAFNFIKENGKTISRNGVEIEERNRNKTTES